MGHGGKCCVSVIRQSQEWYMGNRVELADPLLSGSPGARGGMHASACMPPRTPGELIAQGSADGPV